VDFLLGKTFFERVGDTIFFCKKGWGASIILTYDSKCS
jgi:hypothetical protein